MASIEAKTTAQALTRERRERLLVDLLREQLDRQGLVEATIVGNSMYPILTSGKKISIRKTSGRSRNVDDVIAFEGSDQLVVVHRVVEIRTHGDQRLLRTMGDSCLGTDVWITEDQVLGTVEYSFGFLCSRFHRRALHILNALRAFAGRLLH